MALRVLWGSPLPPIRSGVSDYAAELLPELSRLARVRVLMPPGWDGPGGWQVPAQLELVEADTAPEAGELFVPNLGNNPYHEWLLAPMRQHPSVPVLHDLTLHHLLVESTLGHDRREEYETAMEAAHGADGVRLAEARRFGFSAQRDHFLLAARRWALRGAIGVIVHSQWARRQVGSDVGRLPVLVLPMPARDPGPCDRRELRRRLGAGDDDLLLMHLGFLGPEKGLLEVLGAMAAARRLGVAVRLVLVGEGRSLSSVRAAADALGLADHLHFTGWVAADEMVALPAAADLGVVLRTPSAGETSAAVLRFLACGTPVAVSGLRQFLEWPAAATLRLTPGIPATAELVRAVEEAAAGVADGSWDERRRAARAAYDDGHLPRTAAQRLASFLEEMAADGS